MENKTSVLAFSTLTYCMKGEELLRSRGIPVKALRLSPERTKKGCGYGLEMPLSLSAGARRLLQAGGIPFGELLQ